MEEKYRMAVGILGNAASMLLFAAPILTFSRVIRKKNIEHFSCMPYILTLFNCSVYGWYGLPVVSYKWENFPMITINGFGILFELSFIMIYFYFASPSGKKKVAMLTIPLLLVSSLVGILSAFELHDHHHRKAFVGSVGLVASIAMYGSPLVAMKQVIQTKSVEYMPFYLSFFSFLASSFWMAYGILSHDFLLASPNIIGNPLCIVQLVIYCMYRKSGTKLQPPQTWDIEKPMQNLQVKEENEENLIQYLKVYEEKDEDKAKQQVQLVVNDDAINGKN